MHSIYNTFYGDESKSKGKKPSENMKLQGLGLLGLPLDSHLLAGGSARSPRSLSEKKEGEAVSPRSRAPAWSGPGGACGLRWGRAEGGPGGEVFASPA